MYLYRYNQDGHLDLHQRLCTYIATIRTATSTFTKDYVPISLQSGRPPRPSPKIMYLYRYNQDGHLDLHQRLCTYIATIQDGHLDLHQRLCTYIATIRTATSTFTKDYVPISLQSGRPPRPSPKIMYLYRYNQDGHLDLHQRLCTYIATIRTATSTFTKDYVPISLQPGRPPRPSPKIMYLYRYNQDGHLDLHQRLCTYIATTRTATSTFTKDYVPISLQPGRPPRPSPKIMYLYRYNQDGHLDLHQRLCTYIATIRTATSTFTKDYVPISLQSGRPPRPSPKIMYLYRYNQDGHLDLRQRLCTYIATIRTATSTFTKDYVPISLQSGRPPRPSPKIMYLYRYNQDGHLDLHQRLCTYIATIRTATSTFAKDYVPISLQPGRPPRPSPKIMYLYRYNQDGHLDLHQRLCTYIATTRTATSTFTKDYVPISLQPGRPPRPSPKIMYLYRYNQDGHLDLHQRLCTYIATIRTATSTFTKDYVPISLQSGRPPRPSPKIMYLYRYNQDGHLDLHQRLCTYIATIRTATSTFTKDYVPISLQSGRPPRPSPKIMYLYRYNQDGHLDLHQRL